MKLAILFLIVVLNFEGCLGVTDLPVMARLPDILLEFCPGANVCGVKQTIPEPGLTFGSGYESCCTDCSCSTDCEERGDCCFPKTLPLNNSDEARFKHPRSTCLYPVTIQPHGTVRISYQSYYMITDVPESVHKISSNKSCGDVKVAPWGSLYPVYSAKSKLIYKNMVCATADDVTDGEAWAAVLVCSKPQGFLVLEDSDFLSDICKVHFTYEDNINNINPLKCYSDLKNTCPITGFEEKVDTRLSKVDVIELCSGGLVSPFRGQHTVYANIFCYICNDEYVGKNIHCQLIHKSPRTSRASFVGLIDGTFIIRDHTRSIGGTKELPVACEIAKNDKCRAVFCPSGQIRAQTGECKYLNTIWYDQEFTIYIKLKSDVDIKIDDIFQVSSGKVPPFKSPWPSNWLITLISYETVTGERSSKTFLVILKTRLKKVQPMYFMRKVKKAITKDWLFESNNKTIVLQSSFMPFTTEPFIDELENHGFPSYAMIYHKRSLPWNVLLVTKLYLCDQVELTQSEFSLTYNNDTLFNNITKRYLFNGEFTPPQSKAHGDIRVRLCIEDSGLYETKTNVRSDANAALELFFGPYFAVSFLNLVNQYFYIA